MGKHDNDTDNEVINWFVTEDSFTNSIILGAYSPYGPMPILQFKKWEQFDDLCCILDDFRSKIIAAKVPLPDVYLKAFPKLARRAPKRKKRTETDTPGLPDA